MATQTSGDLQLSKPAASDLVKNFRTPYNSNMDTIDTAVTALNSKFRTISSGSMHDIKTTGMYYLTGGVTDKPTGNGGYYSVTVYNNDLLVGMFANTDGLVFRVYFANNTWTYDQLAMNSNKANKIQSLVTDGTTDNDGDIPIQLSPSQYAVIACYPDRTAPAGYYTNWYSILPFGSVTGNAKYSAKCVKDNLDPLIQTDVRFTVYYIQL